MKRQRRTTGSILEINIENQYYVYAQIMIDGSCAFFDYRSKEQLRDFKILDDCPILFILTVYNDVITQGHWPKVGKMEIRDDLKKLPMKFIQDKLDPQKFRLYNPETGDMIPSTRLECEGLECAAVWEAEHVESRIKDHYNNVPNVWLELLKIK